MKRFVLVGVVLAIGLMKKGGVALSRSFCDKIGMSVAFVPIH